jgi:O-antigen/teichoic acid export membrane protein
MASKKISGFYFRSSVFGILSISAALLNYALYPILTRVLNAQQFGDFAVIVALSNQILGLLLSLNIISIYLVKSRKENQARTETQVIQKVLVWFFLVANLVLFIASPMLHSILKIQGLGSFALLAIILITAVPAVMWTGYLQGHKELVRIGIYSLSASFSKLILASVLAILLGTIGGVWGLLGGAIVGLIVLRALPGTKLPSIGSIFYKLSPDDKRFIKNIRGFFIECLFVVGGLSFLQNYDITLAKALFKPEVAGVYSGISVLSNALYYLAFLLIWIILPEIEIGNDKTNKRVLKTAYTLLGSLALLTIAGELLFKNLIISLLLGQGYANQGSILIFASLFQLTLVAITLYGFYLLVNRKRRATVLGLLVIIPTLFVPALVATNPLHMIQLLWISLVCGFCLYVLGVKLHSLFWKRSITA